MGDDVRYFRLISLAFDIGGKVLRKFLRKSRKTQNLQSLQDFLNDNVHLIYHLWKPKYDCMSPCTPCTYKRNTYPRPFLLKDQWDLLFQLDGSHVHSAPPTYQDACMYVAKQNITEEDLDVTLITILIMHCLQLNTAVSKAVETLRKFRNDLAHRPEPGFDEQTFRSEWDTCMKAIIYLCYEIGPKFKTFILDETDKLKKRNMDPESGMKLLTEMKKLFHEDTDEMLNGIKESNEVVEEKVDIIEQSIEKASKDIKETLDVTKEIQVAVNSVTSKTETVIKETGEKLQETTEVIKEKTIDLSLKHDHLEEIMSSVKTVVEESKTNVEEKVIQIEGTVKQSIEYVKEAQDAAVRTENTVQESVTKIEDVTINIKTEVGNVVNETQTSTKAVANEIQTLKSDLLAITEESKEKITDTQTIVEEKLLILTEKDNVLTDKIIDQMEFTKAHSEGSHQSMKADFEKHNATLTEALQGTVSQITEDHRTTREVVQHAEHASKLSAQEAQAAHYHIVSESQRIRESVSDLERAVGHNTHEVLEVVRHTNKIVGEGNDRIQSMISSSEGYHNVIDRIDRLENRLFRMNENIDYNPALEFIRQEFHQMRSEISDIRQYVTQVDQSVRELKEEFQTTLLKGGEMREKSSSKDSIHSELFRRHTLSSSEKFKPVSNKDRPPFK